MDDIGIWVLLVALGAVVAYYAIGTAVLIAAALWGAFCWAVRRAVRRG